MQPRFTPHYRRIASTCDETPTQEQAKTAPPVLSLEYLFSLINALGERLDARINGVQQTLEKE
eukprot:3934846-Rhodomonas_salina.1